MMHFVDEVRLAVKAGDGGNGSAAFRRARFEPLGGPSGGDGGRGGDIVFVACPQLRTLLDLRYRKRIEAPSGEHGRSKDQYGKAGADHEIRVPIGTVVRDAETGAELVDLTEAGQRCIIAKGGRGGRGNIHFATSTNQAPRTAEDGQPGESLELSLELKLFADVGLVGFPNAGKSTLIAATSRAKPKIANYPFTTLVPNLGVVAVANHAGGRDRVTQEGSFVIADIPGLVEGAAAGKGLGHDFLRHIERTRILLFVVAPDVAGPASMLDQLKALKAELTAFNPDILNKETLIVRSKSDLNARDVNEEAAEDEAALLALPECIGSVCAVTHEGLDALVMALWQKLSTPRDPVAPASPTPADAPSAAPSGAA